MEGTVSKLTIRPQRMYVDYITSIKPIVVLYINNGKGRLEGMSFNHYASRYANYRKSWVVVVGDI